jgi:hypothetical protein
MQAVYAFLTDNKDLLEALSYLAALLGIPIFLFTFISNIRRERREADMNAFAEADARYHDWNMAIMSYPHLDVSWYQNGVRRNDLTEEERHQQDLLFEILTRIIERAFLVYRMSSSSVRHSQWSGWDQFATDYCAKPNYRDWWFGGKTSVGDVSTQFDRDFERYMNGKFAQLGIGKSKRL